MSTGPAALNSLKRFHLHLVSDATGETVSAVARACLVQFDLVEPVTHPWWLVRTLGQVERVVAGVAANPGVVLATVVDAPVRNKLEELCRQIHVPCISVLDPILAALAGHLNVGFSTQPGRQHMLDAEYFRRIDAMHFTLAHDDGQMLDDIDDADIIVVGVSRTSKTPTCMYLANRGIKAANVPLVFSLPLPTELLAAKSPLIVGLTMEPRTLTDVRRSRLKFLTPGKETDYADPDMVREEISEARQLYARQRWPMIDVSHRSIEEVSATILQIFNEHKMTRQRSLS
jgi:regulator of PEP synthase PpsR (kinase-PPPase family)